MDDASPYSGAYQTGVRRNRGRDNSLSELQQQLGDLSSLQQQQERLNSLQQQEERLSNLQRFSLLGDGERGAPDSVVDRASNLSSSVLLSALGGAGAGGLNSEDLLVRLSSLSQGAGGVGARAFGSLGGGIGGGLGGAHSGGSQQSFSTGLPSFATGAGARAGVSGSSPLGSMIGSEEGHGSRLTADLLGLGRLSNLSAGLGARLTALGSGSSSGSDLPRHSKLDMRFSGMPSNLGFGALGAKAGLGSSGYYEDELGGYSAAAALASGAGLGGSGQGGAGLGGAGLGGAGLGGAGGWSGRAGSSLQLASLYDNLTHGSGLGLSAGSGIGKPLPLKGDLDRQDRLVLQQQQLHLHMLEHQQQRQQQQQQQHLMQQQQQQHLVRQHQQMLQRRNEALQLEATAAASRASTSKRSGADRDKGKESVKEDKEPQQDDEQEQEEEEGVAEEDSKGAGAGKPTTKAPAKANAAGAGAGAGVAGAAGSAGAATAAATATTAGAQGAGGSVHKRPPRPDYIVGLNSLDLFMSFTSEYTSPTDPNETLFDTTEILGRECYEAWINTRRAGLKKPEESFRRALTAHVTGADRRRPFPPAVEKSLLVELRKQQTWPCFEGRAGAGDDKAIKIGEQGFRTMGYHEKKAYDAAEAEAATNALGLAAEPPALDKPFLPGGNAAAYGLPYPPNPSQRPPYLNEQHLQMLLMAQGNDMRRVKDALEEGHHVHPSLEQLNANRASVMQLFNMPGLASGADANDAFKAAKRKASDLDLHAISGKRPWSPNAL